MQKISFFISEKIYKNTVPSSEQNPYIYTKGQHLF